MEKNDKNIVVAYFTLKNLALIKEFKMFIEMKRISIMTVLCLY